MRALIPVTRPEALIYLLQGEMESCWGCPVGIMPQLGLGPTTRMCPLVSNPPKGQVRGSARTQGARLPDVSLTVFASAEVISTLTDVSSPLLASEPKGQRWFSLDSPVSLRTGVQLRHPSLSVVSEFCP